MPMSVYVISIGYSPQRRWMKRMCSRLPKFTTRHLCSESIYTLHPHQHIRLSAPNLQLPSYDTLLPPAYEDELWASTVTEYVNEFRIGGMKEAKLGAEERHGEAEYAETTPKDPRDSSRNGMLSGPDNSLHELE
ncbi:uncharacterized protein LTR77_011154 [Saxophila tyrrhenica]|uniref:Uncharacterized protein n=1 Tax=Saxophila tyrrhenica TaxID=1690608 RepID=A0AAV9NX03_9PEZI|nr:hypothetical protein LTR77_011154 [Saxophila tyrrhenica]